MKKTKTMLLAVSLMGFLFNAQNSFGDSADNCELSKKIIHLKEGVIVDSAICMILDSSLTQIKIEKVNGHDLPYAYLFYMQSINGTSLVNVTMKAFNQYVIFDEAGSVINPATMILIYKGRQIVVNDYDEKIYSYIKPTEKKVAYTLYLFRSKATPNSICGLDKNILQEVTFQLKDDAGLKKFGFCEYKYHLTDNTFIYGKYWRK